MQTLSTLGLKTLGIKPTTKPKEHKPAAKLVNESLIEQVTGIGTATLDSVKEDLLQPAPDILAKQVAGVELGSGSHGEMKAGQEVDFSHGGDHAKADAHGDNHGESSGGGHGVTEMGHHYQQEIAHAGAEVSHEQAQERAGEYHHALSELAGLAHGDEQLENVVANAQQQKVEGTVQELSWVERVLAGEKVNIHDSGAWKGAIKGKAASGLWSVAKTSSGELDTKVWASNERAVSTIGSAG